MSDNVNKILNANYHSAVIPICKLLKSHATNVMLLPNNLILMQPTMNGIRNYMIANREADYSNFMYTYFSIPEISKINTKFKKTKSNIDWEIDNGTSYLVVTNDEMNLSKSPVINNPEAVADIIISTYNNIPNWNESNITELLCDESDREYTKLPDSFIEDMVSKKLCELIINGHSILLSRPFLGEMKNTISVGYKVISEDDSKMVLKFKQVEELGNIYTYAAFLIV